MGVEGPIFPTLSGLWTSHRLLCNVCKKMLKNRCMILFILQSLGHQWCLHLLKLWSNSLQKGILWFNILTAQDVHCLVLESPEQLQLYLCRITALYHKCTVVFSHKCLWKTEFSVPTCTQLSYSSLVIEAKGSTPPMLKLATGYNSEQFISLQHISLRSILILSSYLHCLQSGYFQRGFNTHFLLPPPPNFSYIITSWI